MEALEKQPLTARVNALAHFAKMQRIADEKLAEVRQIDSRCMVVMMTDRRYPLHTAAQHTESTKTLDRLIDHFKHDVNAVNDYNVTPLHLAAYSGNLDNILHLVARGAHVNAKNDKGYTSLHCAAFGHDHTILPLLDMSADVNAINNEDWTPLHCAAYKGHFSIVKHLLARGDRRQNCQ